MGRIWENQECLAKSKRELRVKNLGKIWEAQRQNLEVLKGEFSELGSMGGGVSWTKNLGIQLCLTGDSRLSLSSSLLLPSTSTWWPHYGMEVPGASVA